MDPLSHIPGGSSFDGEVDKRMVTQMLAAYLEQRDHPKAQQEILTKMAESQTTQNWHVHTCPVSFNGDSTWFLFNGCVHCHTKERGWFWGNEGKWHVLRNWVCPVRSGPGARTGPVRSVAGQHLKAYLVYPLLWFFLDRFWLPKIKKVFKFLKHLNSGLFLPLHVLALRICLALASRHHSGMEQRIESVPPVFGDWNRLDMVGTCTPT